MKKYRVLIYSRDGDYPFSNIYWDQAMPGNEIRLAHGIVKLDKCAGVDYDTQVKDFFTHEPVCAFCSEDDEYFFKTDAVLAYMKGQ